MSDYIKLLLSSKNNIPVNTELATEIGLNETIVLRQVYYWVEHNESENRNFRDGKYWVYNSMKQWKEDNFPFFSEKTIERAFKSLREKNLIIVGDYSEDRTKRPNWYTINKDELKKLLKKLAGEDTEESQNREEKEETKDNENSRYRQNDGMESDNVTEPYNNIYNIYNNNRDYNTENTYNDFPKENKYNNAFSKEKKKESYAFSDSETKPNKGLDMKYVKNIAEQYIESECVEDSKSKTEEFVNIVSYFCEQYKLRLGKPHKFLKPETIEKLVRKYIEPTELLATMEEDEIIESYRMMIDKFFNTEYNKRGGFDGEIDKTLCYFWNDTIIENLFYRTCYGGIDEKDDD